MLLNEPDDVFAETVNVSPPSITNAVFGGGDVDHVGALRGRIRNAIMRLFVRNDNQSAVRHLAVDGIDCLPKQGAAVHLRANDHIDPRHSPARLWPSGLMAF